jgi:signal transduction histidine kinase
MAISRRPARSRPIRLFLISMFAVPLVSLVALYAYAASTTIANAVIDQKYNEGVKIVANGFGELTQGLPQEQAATYVWLSSGRTMPSASMLAARKIVDAGFLTAKNVMTPVQGQETPHARAAQDALFAALGQIGKTRAAVDAGTISPLAAFTVYSNLVDAQWRFYFSSNSKDASFTDVSIGATNLSYAIPMGSREATLVGGALVGGGQMSAAARQQFTTSVAIRRSLMSEGIAGLTPELGAPYVALENSPQYHQFLTMEDQIMASPAGQPLPVNPTAWQQASGAYLAGLGKAELDSGAKLGSMSNSLANRLVLEAILAGGLGLLAVIGSIFLIVWFGRKVTRDMTSLNDSVRAMADERLPRVVERLRRGEDVDVLAESPAPDTSTIFEVSRIAESFATVQAAAVAAAVDQAKLRKGVNQVFLNISMRNQSLLHRQLGMLDSMERRTSEPEALADLFRIDHLTTRMRRHAEGLIILSGSVPGRGWRDPVPVIDVMRAAVAEVEDYVRVDVNSESDDLVAGSAVSDVIHLIAELVENATVFSPPNTRIEVRAERVGTGLVAEIEDRGLGLAAEELADINRRLASSQEFDLAHSDQLGLFVVSQLAARHDIEVSLRRSVYGGTTAVVLLPFGVVVRAEEAPLIRSDQGEWVSDGARALTGRHRLPAPNRALDRALDRAPDLATRTDEWPAAADASGSGPAASQTAPLAPWEIGPPPTLPTAPPAADRALPPGPPWDAETTESWSMPTPAVPAGAFRREPPRPEGPGREPPARAPHELERPGDTSSDSHLGMPIRVPQASLAPQLRARHDAAPGAQPASQLGSRLRSQLGAQLGAEHEAPEVTTRSPEATRNMLSLMQQGWRRGRVDDLDHPEGAPGNGTDR